MIKSELTEAEELEKKSFQRRQKLSIERTLQKLVYAARINDSELWRAAEERFIVLLHKTEYGGLPSKTTSKYVREYHNIRPENEILVKLLE